MRRALSRRASVPRTMARMSDLDQALNQAIEQYRRSHPASERLHQQALGVLPGGNTRSVLQYSAECEAE